jgi:uncharacterized protein YbjQ (UPF0145 family)
MIMSTTTAIDGRPAVSEYVGIVTGEAVMIWWM